jgi:ketosteroid isomerase-like protein
MTQPGTLEGNSSMSKDHNPVTEAMDAYAAAVCAKDLEAFIALYAFGSAAVTFSGISEEGTRLRSMTNRITMGLEKKAGVWKVAHEHSSLPIDMATGKVIFTPSPA